MKNWRPEGLCRDEKCLGDKVKEIGTQFDLGEKEEIREASRCLPFSDSDEYYFSIQFFKEVETAPGLPSQGLLSESWHQEPSSLLFLIALNFPPLIS